ncbi:MAG: DoxX family protein [Chitinophagales bacterium]
MTTETKRIISILLMAIPSLMLIASGLMKLMGTQQIIQGLTKGGLGNYIVFFGVIELIAVALFIYPKTYKIGFLLLCCYLGGALSIELAGGHPPVTAILLILVWISMFLRNREMFLHPSI